MRTLGRRCSKGVEDAMAETVDVTIPVDAAVAGRLENPAMRRVVGHMVNRMLAPASLDEFRALLARTRVQAEERGLTNDILEAELAAYNAERRGTGVADEP